MQVRKFVVLGLLAGFLAAPVARAVPGDESRDPAAASDTDAPVKHKKKKKKSAHKAKKHAAKKSAKHAKSHHKSSSGSTTGTGTHYPTQPGGSGFADIPNEKKDDLPPPATPPNND
ncbi:MAG: hypothetical protein ACXVB9_04670 [Bdellovibrionota bacterium]